MSLVAASRWLALALAYLFFLQRWFHDPAAAVGEPRVSSLVVPLLAFASIALLCAVADRSAAHSMRAELFEVLRLPRREGALLALVIVVSFLYQLPTMIYPAALLHSDAAINGLMGLHIAQGRVAPAFYYGQEFMGTLFSHLLAAMFFLTGPFVGGTAVLTWVLYAGFLAATFYLVRQAANGTVAVAVGIWLAVPPSWLILTLAQSEYAQFLLLSSASVTVVAACIAGRLRHPAWWCVAGGLFGLAFWAHAMSAMVVAAAGFSIVLLLPPRRVASAAWRLALGFVVGLAPGLVGWGGRVGRFVEWFLEGGGRGGEATLGEAVVGLGRESMSALLLGGGTGRPVSFFVALTLLALVVISAAGLVGAALVACRRERWRSSPAGVTPPRAPQRVRGEEAAESAAGSARAVPSTMTFEAAAAAVPLAGFVLLQLVVLAARRYADVPSQYTAPLYLGLPAVVAVSAWWLLRRWGRNPSAVVAIAVLSWACIPLPGSIAWLRSLPANQASMDASIAALRAAGVETCRGPYWDAYRLSYLSLESIVCASSDVRRVPTYAERVARPGAAPPAFLAAPQRREALEQYMLRLEERGLAWTYLRTPRFEALLPQRR